MELLDTITRISHGAGTADFVKGGGGNTSTKDHKTLWIKPSGTALGELTPETFVPVCREKVNAVFQIDPNLDAKQREAMVTETLMASVLDTSKGRPSVETPLHNLFSATYVAHTHPALVNGMTCAADGEEACANFFPEALWVGLVDPGYSLCVKLKEAFEEYVDARGHEPEVVFLKNHGLIVAGDNPYRIMEVQGRILAKLLEYYHSHGVNENLSGLSTPSDDSDAAKFARQLSGLMDGKELTARAIAGLEPPAGALTPDHIVYSKAEPYTGDVTQEGLADFKARHGDYPRIFQTGNMVYAVGATEKAAKLALELAIDGAQVCQLTQAFGGAEFMTEKAVAFIENWEAESYRSKQST